MSTLFDDVQENDTIELHEAQSKALMLQVLPEEEIESTAQTLFEEIRDLLKSKRLLVYEWEFDAVYSWLVVERLIKKFNDRGWNAYHNHNFGYHYYNYLVVSFNPDSAIEKLG